MSASILVIEDDPASLELMVYLLGAHGHRTTAAGRGDEGLAAARATAPDLVVCDIQLPGKDGYAIVGELKADAATRAIPVVAVTALAMVGDRERVLAAGFDAYVSKPIDPATFVTQIEPLLRQEQRTGQRHSPAASEAIRPSLRFRGTILAVDDSSVNLDLMSSIFEPLGYRVLRAENVAAGMQLARQEAPQVIVSDIGLPEADGLAFLGSLAADPALRAIPVIMITATHARPRIRKQAIALGAARFLVRPLDSHLLLREVEACLRTPPAQEERHGRDSGR